MYGNLCEPWDVVWCGDVQGFAPDVLADATQAASELLWLATGERFGNCPVTVRPCRQECAEAPIDSRVWSSGHWIDTGWPYPTLLNGAWINLACGLCLGDCACTTSSEIVLPDPVWQITDVTIDGISITATGDDGYALYDGQRLVRRGGDWPLCQDWSKTSGTGVWTITARFGAPVPTLGKMGVGALALEIARMCSGMNCNLPPTIQQVVRQGVTMVRADISSILKYGLTGLDITDRFIRSVNPAGIQDRARIYSPDRMQPRVQG